MNDDMYELGQMAYKAVTIEGSEKWESLSKIHKWYWACIEKKIRNDEREACAKVCEAMIDPVSAAWRDKRPDEAAEFDASDAGKQACADAIRMRSNK